MKLFPSTENKAPPNVHCIEVLTQTGIKLRASFAVPKQAKGTVFILQGRAEFVERYFEVMNDLIRRGFAVATFDWRGQGGSQRLLKDSSLGHITNFADYDADIDAIYSRVLVAHCPKPYYGLAHSTGGHMMLRALRGKKWLERTVITSPLMGMHFKPWPEPVARGLAWMAKASGLGALPLPGIPTQPVQSWKYENNPLTSDRKRWDRDAATLVAHPELGTGAPTYAWLRGAIDSIDELQTWPKDRGPSCQTLIVMAGQDRVVNNVGTIRFLNRAPGFSSLTIADSRHEILNEKPEIRERFLAAFDAFIQG